MPKRSGGDQERLIENVLFEIYALTTAINNNKSLLGTNRCQDAVPGVDRIVHALHAVGHEGARAGWLAIFIGCHHHKKRRFRQGNESLASEWWRSTILSSSGNE